jgi:hypothetical protein
LFLSPESRYAKLVFTLRFEVLMMVKMSVLVFWVETPFGLVNISEVHAAFIFSCKWKKYVNMSLQPNPED